MKRNILTVVLALALVLSLFQTSYAKVSAEEAAKLKTTLTPMGAEKAGNKEGTIPAWDGKSVPVSPGFQQGQKRPDPFPNEKPVLTITAANMDKYADKITEGQKYLLKKYPTTYRMDVYPTHRTQAAPQWLYDATYKNATNAITKDNGLSFDQAYCGVPFPIPQTGNECMYNHLTAWRGKSIEYDFRIYIVRSDGKPVLVVQAQETCQYPYYFNDVPYEKWNKDFWHFLQVQVAPPFKAGETILIRDPIDQYKIGRQCWQYLVGQRRVRRAPSISYDTPDFVASGQNYFDEPFIFLGSLDRYTWKILGKKEMYMPYNNNKAASAKDADVIGSVHNNPDFIRWELHRVWVVEANLAPGKRHVVPKKRFYLDEDSWFALQYDGWDGQGQLWRHTQSWPIVLPDVPAMYTAFWSIMNFQQGGRTVSDVMGEMPKALRVIPPKPDNYFTPDALAGAGVR